MTVRTIAPHRHAIADVHDIICYYRELAGTAVAENFAIEIDCLDKGSNRDRASSGPSQFPRLQHYPHIPTFRGWYFFVYTFGFMRVCRKCCGLWRRGFEALKESVLSLGRIVSVSLYRGYGSKSVRTRRMSACNRYNDIAR